MFSPYSLLPPPYGKKLPNVFLLRHLQFFFRNFLMFACRILTLPCQNSQFKSVGSCYLYYLTNLFCFFFFFFLCQTKRNLTSIAITNLSLSSMTNTSKIRDIGPCIGDAMRSKGERVCSAKNIDYYRRVKQTFKEELTSVICADYERDTCTNVKVPAIDDSEVSASIVYPMKQILDRVF